MSEAGDNSTLAQKRRWFHWSLRTMLVAVTLLGVAVAVWPYWRVERQIESVPREEFAADEGTMAPIDAWVGSNGQEYIVCSVERTRLNPGFSWSLIGLSLFLVWKGRSFGHRQPLLGCTRS